jgi:hypothetical protein
MFHLSTQSTFVITILLEIVMDWTRARQGKETWLQPSGEIQDKTRQDRTILED